MNLRTEAKAIRSMVNTGVEILTPVNRKPNLVVRSGAYIYALVMYPFLRLTGETAGEIQKDQEASLQFHQDVKSGRFPRF